MLRPLQSRRTVFQPFICWKCLAKLPSTYVDGRQANVVTFRGFSSGLVSSRLGQGIFLQKGVRYFGKGSIRHASVESLSDDIPSQNFRPPESRPIQSSIRQRLRDWERENASSYPLPPPITENAGQGHILNNLIRTNDGDYRMEFDMDEVEDDGVDLGRDQLLDVGNRRGFLLAGDLVELRSVVGTPQELAIFVRELGNQSQFYTMSGRWINRSSQSAQFFVPHFVEEGELDGIRPHLPTEDVSSVMRDKLQDFPSSVPRVLGKHLIHKMLDFLAQSDAAYQANSGRLDNAHELIAHPTNYTYASLEQIAEKLLHHVLSRTEGSKFPDHVLYAVHTSLLRDDVGFRAQTKGTLRSGGQYEISALRELKLVNQVRLMVRSHRENEADKQSGFKHLQASTLERFAISARHLVDLSRNLRQFTEYGTLGPSKTKYEGEHPSSSELTQLLSDLLNMNGGRMFILFLESWAALTSFGSKSTLNGIGSEILRAIQRYGESDLDQSTAWTFLQEIGFITPWENRLAFDLRLPGTGGRLLAEPGAALPNLPRDKLRHLRKDWAELPVYCIDDPGAHEIDDGISVETTDISDEYWVHIHAADPASHTSSDGPAAAYAESTVESIYMPDRVLSMMHMDHVQAYFSLAPGRPSLTFSARMNRNGHILDFKVTPGTVREVFFLSPAVVNEIVLGSSWSEGEKTVRSVGTGFTKSSASRPMLKSHQLSEKHKADLRLLNEIGDAHAAVLRANGGVDQSFQARPRLSISPQNHFISKYQRNQNERDPHYSGHYDTDPGIQLSTVDATTLPQNEGNLVQSFMLVAAQVAARWCNDRGIPIPYRITPRNPSKEDPADFFRRKILPSRTEHGVAPLDTTMEYLRLIGGVLPSTIPSPHAAVGVAMMARCTSPLRRFTDLLVHWQIGAALLEEARLGESLVGNTKDDFLPFSKARIDALLPRLDTREKIIKYGQKEAERHFLCLFLVRAWKFKEADIPSTFSFVVRNINLDERKLFGILTDFSTRSQCYLPEEMNVEDIHVGDKLQVELEDVNVYYRRIQVKALRRLEVPGGV